MALARKRSANSCNRFRAADFCRRRGAALRGFALDKVLVVVAAIADELALADFHDAADELVEKFAVVRDDENRAGIILQITLKPEQRFEVEMVRRLVEQQQVRLLREQTREVRAHDPAAAHFARGPVEILFAKAEAGEDLLGLGFELVAAVLSEVAHASSLRSSSLRKPEACATFHTRVPERFHVYGRIFLRQKANRRRFFD